MSNFHPTIGRNVQYIGVDNKIYAAVITSIQGTGAFRNVTLSVLNPDGSVESKNNVTEYVDTFETNRRPQSNTYRLHWQGR